MLPLLGQGCEYLKSFLAARLRSLASAERDRTEAIRSSVRGKTVFFMFSLSWFGRWNLGLNGLFCVLTRCKDQRPVFACHR